MNQQERWDTYAEAVAIAESNVKAFNFDDRIWDMYFENCSMWLDDTVEDFSMGNEFETALQSIVEESSEYGSIRYEIDNIIDGMFGF